MEMEDMTCKGGKLSEATKTKRLAISEPNRSHLSPSHLILPLTCKRNYSGTPKLKKNISHFNSQDRSLPSEHLAEEEVARLSGELEWLREETRHGDRKVEELQDQVLGISCSMFCCK